MAGNVLHRPVMAGIYSTSVITCYYLWKQIWIIYGDQYITLCLIAITSIKSLCAIMASVNVTFHRTGFRSFICSLMSSLQLWVFTTVLILKATWYAVHHCLTRWRLCRWCLLPCRLPITMLVSSSKLSQEMARMSRSLPGEIMHACIIWKSECRKAISHVKKTYSHTTSINYTLV